MRRRQSPPENALVSDAPTLAMSDDDCVRKLAMQGRHEAGRNCRADQPLGDSHRTNLTNFAAARLERHSRSSKP
jgi:hypothetical protein